MTTPKTTDEIRAAARRHIESREALGEKCSVADAVVYVTTRERVRFNARVKARTAAIIAESNARAVEATKPTRSSFNAARPEPVYVIGGRVEWK